MNKENNMNAIFGLKQCQGIQRFNLVMYYFAEANLNHFCIMTWRTKSFS